MRTSAILALGSLALACASAQAPATGTSTGNVAPSDQTVIAEVDPALDAQDIYIVNNSSAHIIVTSVRLYACQNVQNPCTQIPLQIPIAPHNRKRIESVRAAQTDRPFSYRYSWTWSASSPP